MPTTNNRPRAITPKSDRFESNNPDSPLSNPVDKEMFREVPCTESVEGNEHTMLVVAKTGLQTATCWKCQLARVQNKTAKQEPVTQEIGA